MSATTDLLATVTADNNLVQQDVNVAGVTGTYVPVSASGLGASPLVVFNWDPQTQLAGFLAALQSGAGATLVAIGDSTTLGFGSAVSGFRELSYVAEMTQVLNLDGVTAQSANFLGQGNENGDTTDNRVTLLGNASYVGIYDAGGQVIETSAVGDGFTFTLPTAGSYNELKLDYIDMGSGSVTVAVDGVTVGSLTFGNTGQTLTATLAIPAGVHDSVTVTATGTAPTYIEGVSFVNTTADAVQVYNAGIGGWGSGNANTSVYNGQALTGSANGFGQVAGAVALSPNLALVDLGINDINGADNLGVPVPVATIVANIEQIVATLQAAGSDVILVIPEPFAADAYATELPALRAALQQFALKDNIALIDLSATYGNSEAALAAAGLMSDGAHPNATLYADIGTQIAGLLANAVNGANAAAAATVSNAASGATLSGTASVNTLQGTGGNDTYIIAASDQQDTIINGAGTTPAGTAIFEGVRHDQLWFSQSGSNLVITVLGTDRQVVVQGWFGASAGAALAQLQTSDAEITTDAVNKLVSAMASFAAANPSFNPETSSPTSLQDSSFGSTLQAAVAADWTNLPACFLVGTQIATPRGPRVIETLQPGDEVITLHAGPQKLRWIGRRTYSAAFANADPMLRPVRIAAGAIAPGVPGATLNVSPGHGMSLDGVLVHAWRLLNGVSITQPEVSESVTYLHLELDTHEILLAENCPAESLRGEEFCQTFENVGSRKPRHATPPPRLPLLTQGFQLEKIRARLARRAGLGPEQLAARGDLIGFVEQMSGGRVRGWARHDQAPDVPVCLSIHAGGRRVAMTLANHYRHDVRAAGLGSGACGFEVMLPPGLEGPLEVRRVGDGAPLQVLQSAFG